MTREGAADYLTNKLAESLAAALGKPLKDGWSVKYDPEREYWQVGWQKRF